ncbi:MAG TPA: hypothetical protein VNG69_05700, partial [Casimicrobiaceae bacterium]|nr:hypothetical protein [Casimicrobiaceae bacterium]
GYGFDEQALDRVDDAISQALDDLKRSPVSYVEDVRRTRLAKWRQDVVDADAPFKAQIATIVAGGRTDE